MNMNKNPTRDELKQLLSGADDEAAHHMVWVGFDGEVHIDPIPHHLSPVGYYESMKDVMKFRLETCQQGNRYVGDAAAADRTWVDQLFGALEKNWTSGFTGYQDLF